MNDVSVPGKFLAAWFTLGGVVALIRGILWLTG